MKDLLGSFGRFGEDVGEGFIAEFADNGLLEAQALRVGEEEAFAEVERRLVEDRELPAGCAGQARKMPR